MHPGRQPRNLGRLIVDPRRRSPTGTSRCSTRENAQTYWPRDLRHDLVISMNFGRAANKAFCRVMEKWVRHFFGVSVGIRPLPGGRGPRTGRHSVECRR